MSQLTCELLGTRKARKDSKWPDRLREIDRILGEAYGTPRLGNFRDPVREIIYIVLSARTNEPLYRSTYRSLMDRFPTIESLSKARLTEIKECIGEAGLGKKRAWQLKQIGKQLTTDFGSESSQALRNFGPQDSYCYLTSLPGVGPKTALCVMMYSLGYDVFPVDTHIQRIASRLGLIGAKVKHHHAQKILPRQVPEGLSYSLHVRMISHGRRICRPIYPECGSCRLITLCKTGQRIGTYPSVSAETGKKR